MLFVGDLKLTCIVAMDPKIDPGEPCVQLLEEGPEECGTEVGSFKKCGARAVQMPMTDRRPLYRLDLRQKCHE